MKQFRLVIEAFIEADSVEEAEEAYVNGDYFVDGHTFYIEDDNGMEVEVEAWDAPGRCADCGASTIAAHYVRLEDGTLEVWCEDCYSKR